MRKAVDPLGLANPGKILPSGRGCVEAGFRGAGHMERTQRVLGHLDKNEGVPPVGDTP